MWDYESLRLKNRDLERALREQLADDVALILNCFSDGEYNEIVKMQIIDEVCLYFQGLVNLKLIENFVVLPERDATFVVLKSPHFQHLIYIQIGIQ